MTELEAESDRRLFVVALLAGLFTAAISSAGFAAVSLLAPARSFVLLSIPGVPSGIGAVIAFLGWWLSGALWHVPFLLVVLLTLADPTPRTVTGSAIIMYGVGFVVTFVGRQAVGTGTTLATFATPLTHVVEYLAVAAVVWLAYHVETGQLTDAGGNARQHPLWAVVSDTQLNSDLTLQRGVLAVVPAALVGAGGLALTGIVHDLLQPSSTSGLRAVRPASVGIPPAELPFELVAQAAFLLAVLFVTGPQPERGDLLKGIALIVAVQAIVTLLAALVFPNQAVDLWAPEGPVLRPLAGVTTFVGIAAAVWLAFHDGLERITSHPRR